MLKREEFNQIWNKDRSKEIWGKPSEETWDDICKVFETCDELYQLLENIKTEINEKL